MALGCIKGLLTCFKGSSSANQSKQSDTSLLLSPKPKHKNPPPPPLAQGGSSTNNAGPGSGSSTSQAIFGSAPDRRPAGAPVRRHVDPRKLFGIQDGLTDEMRE